MDIEKNQKKIMIVDDSALMRRVLSDIISSDADFRVIYTSVNGQEALDRLEKETEKPDVIISDINMPVMDGLVFMEKLLENKINIPVVVASTVAIEGADETIRALELGAFDFITKPGSFSETRGDDFRDAFLAKVKCAASNGQIYEVKKTPAPTKQSFMEIVQKHLDHAKNDDPINKDQTVTAPNTQVLVKNDKVEKKPHKTVSASASKLVAIACSTGGPKSLQQVIPLLPKELDAPVVLVQHMPEGFTGSLAKRLDELSEIQVKEAAEGDILQKGCVYIAKGGSQMRIKKSGAGYVISLNSHEPAVGGLKPCADLMYESLADNTDYDDYTCVVLTGMGGDGTQGIKKMNNSSKNMYVIGQDQASCVVYGMPKVLFESGLTDEVVTLNDVAKAIVRNVGVR